MSSVRRKPKGIPFSGRGREKKQKAYMALPHRPTGREHLCSARKGVAQSGESEARRNSLVHLSVVYKVQHGLSINLVTPRKKSLSLSKGQV